MGVLNLAMSCKTDINSVSTSGIGPTTNKLNEKASKENSIWDMNVMWEIYVL